MKLAKRNDSLELLDRTRPKSSLETPVIKGNNTGKTLKSSNTMTLIDGFAPQQLRTNRPPPMRGSLERRNQIKLVPPPEEGGGITARSKNSMSAIN
jgi:hypothetical protein